MQHTETIINNQEYLGFASLSLMLLFAILVFYIALKVFAFINLRLKVIKLKKMSKKQDFTNYTLRLNSKGMPVMLVNVSNPADIILI